MVKTKTEKPEDNTVTGECFCGEIKYKLIGPLKPGRSCHCSRCRKAFSGSGSAMTFVEGQNFEWEKGKDNLKQYTNKKEVGLGFCNICGSTIAALYKGEVFGITLGTLNNDPKVIISEHIYVGSKACWDKIDNSAPQYMEHVEN